MNWRSFLAFALGLCAVIAFVTWDNLQPPAAVVFTCEMTHEPRDCPPYAYPFEETAP